MNNNYKWNGTSFNSMGIIIEKTPIPNKPKHSYNQYTIPGRSGYLAIDNKTFEPLFLSLECHFDTNNVADINELRAWLDGYGTLQLDDEKEYTGYISNSISFDKITHFRKFLIQFTLQPLAKATTATTINALSLATISVDTYGYAYPKITITGTGDISLTLNGTQFTIYDADGTYVLDCEAKIITKNGINQSSNMSGNFPELKNGNNSLVKSGTITALTIEYYKTFI